MERIFALRRVVTWRTSSLKRGRLKFSREGAEIFDEKVVGRGEGGNVNEWRKRSMERRNEYEINSIPPSAAWRNSMHLYALAGKAFAFPSIAFSLRVHASSLLLSLSPFFPFFSPPRYDVSSRYLFPPSLSNRIFERLFTRLVAQFHGVVSRAPATTMDKRAEKGRLKRGPPASRYCSSL